MPFDLDGEPGEIGVVLVHGFTGSPFEVRHLGERLAGVGYRVHAPTLPGHETTVEDLDRTHWSDWASCVSRALDAMAARTKHVAIVGQSLGGLLALHAGATRRDLACVVSLAAPLWLGGLGALAAKHAGRLGISRLRKLGGSDVRDRSVRDANPAYRTVPVRALGELAAFMRVVDEELPRVTAPLLVIHAAQDHTAPVACASRIAERAHAKRIRILPRSYHLIAADVERDIVASETIHFVRTACNT